MNTCVTRLTLPEHDERYPQYGMLPAVPVEFISDLDCRIHVNSRASFTLQHPVNIIAMQEAFAMVAWVRVVWPSELQGRRYWWRVQAVRVGF